METAFSPTPPPALAKRRRRWLRGVLILLALLILAPLAFYGYLRYTAGIAWDAAEAEADRLDPDWRLTQLLLKRRVVPDKENSALHIIAVAGKARSLSALAWPHGQLIFAGLPANTRLNARQEQTLRAEIAKYSGLLDEARQTKNFAHGRFPINIAPIFFMTDLPDHYPPVGFADLLGRDAFLLGHEGKIDEAIASCRASLCAARSMGDDPFIMSFRWRVSIQGGAIIVLERTLAQGVASERALKQMQALLALEIKESDWIHALRGERAFYHSFFDDIRAGVVPASSLAAMFNFNGSPPRALPVNNLADWLADTFPSTLLNSYPEYLNHMTRLIETAKLPPHEQRPRVLAWDQDGKISQNRVVKALATHVQDMLDSHCGSQALLRCAMTALACERYRLQHKTWPASLDVLVEKKLLDAVPLDPIDGKPLRYRKGADMIVIYSIGNDEKDDGGHIDRKQLDGPGVDIGFRLWALEQRGAAAVP